MKITLSINSEHAVELSYKAVVSCLDDLGDAPELADFFSALISHPSSNVRYILAQKECLPIADLAILAKDPHMEVIREVSQNKTALNGLSADLFIGMIERDICIAMELVGRLKHLKNDAIRNSVIDAMRKCKDPELIEKLDKYISNCSGSGI